MLSEETVNSLLGCHNLLKKLFIDGYFENDEIVLEKVRVALAAYDLAYTDDKKFVSENVVEEVQHYLIRPPVNAYNVERWTGTEWIPDDGEPGICFSGQSEAYGIPYAWVPNCACSLTDKNCPSVLATNRTCYKFKCANVVLI
jgi:hypothetical protein